MNTLVRGVLLAVALAFALALAVTGCAEVGGGANAGETLDVEPASGEESFRATTTVDGEEIAIEAWAELEPGVTDDGQAFDHEILRATITGADGTVYAELRLGVLTDELTGTLDGSPFADLLAGESSGTRDWAQLSTSQVGVILSEVSRRADATIAAATHREVERLLGLVGEAGPLLAILPTLVGGTPAVCGDGTCSVDETDELCPEDCGCAAEAACGGVAPFGCYCGDDCAESGDCCVDACMSCGAGCPTCQEGVSPCGGCADVSNVCDGTAQCASGEDEAQCGGGACAAGQLACDDGSCRDYAQFCDGVADCAGGEDELCTCAYCEAG